MNTQVDILSQQDKLLALIESLTSKKVELEEQILIAQSNLNASTTLQAVRASLESEIAKLESEIPIIQNEIIKSQEQKKNLEQKLTDVEEKNRQFFEQQAQNSQNSSNDSMMGASLFGVLDRNEILAIVHESIINELNQQSANLANLYSTNCCLYETLDHQEVITIVREIIVNLVGSEQLAIFELSNDGSHLSISTSFGIETDLFQKIPIGHGLIGQTAVTGNTYLTGQDDSVKLSEEADVTACIPLKLYGKVIGVAVIFRLLPQKTRFVDLDIELFDLLTTHAATAIYCSDLHAGAPRKILETSNH